MKVHPLKNLLDCDNSFSIACLNVRGFLSKYDEIKTLLNASNLDVLGLCETFLDENVDKYEYMIDGYNAVAKHRNKHGGGVLVFVKQNIKYESIDIKSSTDIESVWINIKHDKGNFVVGTMYRPPSASRDYYSGMLEQLDFVNVNHDKAILMGNLNFNYKIDESLHSNPLYHIESLYDMKQLVLEPTRVTLTTSTLLDVILSNVSDLHARTGVYRISLSDHYMVYSLLKFPRNKHKHNEIEFRNYKNFNVNNFLQDLKKCEEICDTVWDEHDLDTKWNAFKHKFIQVSNKHAPIHVRRLKIRNNPWITKEIVKLMYQRDFCKDKAAKFNDDEAWEEYKVLRNKITKLIKKGKRKYATDKINENKNDPKKLWKVLNELTGRTSLSNSQSSINANKFNDFFNTIGNDTVSQIDKQNVTDHDIYWKCSKSVYSFAFKQITVDSVQKHVLKFGDGSSVDVLGFDSKLLFLANEVIAPILCKFYNSSLITMNVPRDWKLSRVTPVYKGKGDIDDESNYRPISVICHLAKLMEKEVQKQVTDYLVEHNLISEDQSAFLKHHNTQTALHRVTDDWLWNMNDGLVTGICALDIKKCFDTINHDILCKKLEYYGFDENVVKWFKSYLSSRGHKVCCNNECSDVKYVDIGVPQGSVLGPTLFLIYINDISNYLEMATCNLYADDVLLYVSGQNVNEVNEKLQRSVNNIKVWYDKNLLVVNASKSNVLMVTTKQREHFITENIDVLFGQEKLENVDTCQYLGVHIDKNMNWHYQIDRLSKDLNAKIWNLSHLRSFLPIDVLLDLYKSLIQPKIDYAITIWGYTNEVNLERIQHLQNRVARVILNNFDFVNTRGIELVSKLGIMNIKQRRDYFMALLMYKSIHGLAPNYLCNEIIMEIEVSDRTKRHINENNVHMPDAYLEITKNAFSCKGPYVWNSLPNFLKECTSLTTFKMKAKKHYLHV